MVPLAWKTCCRACSANTPQVMVVLNNTGGEGGEREARRGWGGWPGREGRVHAALVAELSCAMPLAWRRRRRAGQPCESAYRVVERPQGNCSAPYRAKAAPPAAERERAVPSAFILSLVSGRQIPRQTTINRDLGRTQAGFSLSSHGWSLSMRAAACASPTRCPEMLLAFQNTVILSPQGTGDYLFHGMICEY